MTSADFIERLAKLEKRNNNLLEQLNDAVITRDEAEIRVEHLHRENGHLNRVIDTQNMLIEHLERLYKTK